MLCAHTYGRCPTLKFGSSIVVTCLEKASALIFARRIRTACYAHFNEGKLDHTFVYNDGKISLKIYELT